MKSGCCYFTGSGSTNSEIQNEPGPGACELFQAAPQKDHILFSLKNGGDNIVTSPKTCNSVWLPFLENTDNNNRNNTIQSSSYNNNDDDKECWVTDHSYGMTKDGACDDAEVIIVYAPNSVIELGKTQGWWGTNYANIYLISVQVGAFSASKCQEACVANADCGGWEFVNNESCILKSKLDCSPTLARSPTLNSAAGVKGCVNPDSTVPAEQNALDTSKLWYLNCDQPRCTRPYSEGTWAEDTFVPNAENNCWYKQFTPQELYDDCAQDRWIVISGGSNTLSFFIQMVSLFAPRVDVSHFVSYGEAFAYSIIDIVFKKDSMPILSEDDNGILYENQKMFCQIDNTLPCGGSLVFQDGKADWGIKYLNAIDQSLAAAPYEAGATRLTVVAGQIWTHAAATLESIEKVRKIDGNGWGSNAAKVLFYGQAMVWYPCNVEGWCEEPALGSTNDEMLDKYRSDMEVVLDVGENTCATDGYDCFFATHAYGGTVGPRSRDMINTLNDLTSQYDWAHFIDYNGIVNTDEIIDGHLTAAMMLPVQTMMWNTVCKEKAYGCPEAIHMTPTCWTDCKGRGGGDSCESCKADNWVCMNSRQCKFEPLDPVPWRIAIEGPSLLDDNGQPKSTCMERMSLGGPYSHNDNAIVAAVGRSRRSPTSSLLNSPTSSPTIPIEEETLCLRRVWCGSTADGWVVGFIIFLLGLGVIIIPTLMPLWKSDEETKEKSLTQINEVQHPNTPDQNAELGLTAKETQYPSSADNCNDDVSIDPDDYLEENNNNTNPNSFGHISSVKAETATTYRDPDTYDMEIDVDADNNDQFPVDENNIHAESSVDKAYQEAESIRYRGSLVALREESEEKNVVALREESEEKNVVATTTEPKKKEFLKSLGIARLLASQHIVLGHLYAKGATPEIYFFRWGYTWVPWFFILSGYVLTHARLNSSKPTHVDRSFSHVAKRMSTIFPMYAFGLFLTMILRVARGLKLPRYDTLIFQSFLMQSWIPIWTENAFLSQCWFLSNLIIYWAVFGYVYNQIRLMTLKSAFVGLCIISIIPWFVIIVPALSNDIEFNWYSQHKWGETDTAMDIWTILLKFNPIFYFHIFLFGMLLAVLRHRLKTEIDSALAVFLTFFTQYGAVIGYFGLILIFTIKGLQPAAYKLSARISILLPLQGMMMLGLSPLPRVIESGGFQDPLAQLFSYAPSWIGDMSYCQYVLQFIMYNLFPVTKVSNPSFFLYLWGASILSYKFIQEPAAKSWRAFLSTTTTSATDNQKGSFTPGQRTVMALLVPSSAMAFILLIAKASYVPSRNNIAVRTANFTALPPLVRIADEAVDMTLNWKMDVDDDRLVPINPSLLFHDDGVGGIDYIRTVRAHHIYEETIVSSDNEKTEHAVTFQSSIMLGQEKFTGNLSLGFDDESIQKWGLNGNFTLQQADNNMISHKRKNKGFTNLCEPPQNYNQVKNWTTRKIVTGPEDPKLFAIPAAIYNNNDEENSSSSWSLTFSSFPPAALLIPNDGESMDDCKWNKKAVVQMYLAADGPTLTSGGEAQAVQLDCGNTYGTEKNWIAFAHEETGNLYYVYSIEPHVIIHARPTDGTCVEQYKTSSRYLRSTAPLELRGSATAIRYSDSEYLALMHTNNNGLYTTIAYTFQSKPPFAIRRISKTLPLHSRAFASSLNVIQNKVLIGYGEADMKSRILVMSRKYFESFFDWCLE